MLAYNFSDRLEGLLKLAKDRRAFMRAKSCEVSRKLLNATDRHQEIELTTLREVCLEEYELAGQIISKVRKAKADFENNVPPTEIVKDWHVKTSYNDYVWSAVFCKDEEFADFGYVDITEVFRLNDYLLLDVNMDGELLVYLAMGIRDDDYMAVGEPIMTLKLFNPFSNDKERQYIMNRFEGIHLSDLFELAVNFESEVLANV